MLISVCVLIIKNFSPQELALADMDSDKLPMHTRAQHSSKQRHLFLTRSLLSQKLQYVLLKMCLACCCIARHAVYLSAALLSQRFY